MFNLKLLMKNLISIFIISVFLFSCNTDKKQSVLEKFNVKKDEVAANYKSIEVDIEGMTCEIGCARTIESKLSKFNGVTYSNVSFEAKKGQFTFDSNKISQEDIISKITGIAGGEIYSISKTKEIKAPKKEGL